MATLVDIAKKTKFSITTVSRALNGYPDINDKTRELIIKTAKEMEYLPNASARNLVMKRSWTIGVVIDELTGAGLSHWFFSKVLERFRRKIEEKGYDLLFISRSIGDSVQSYKGHCKQKGIDGVLILCADFYNEHIKELIESDIPNVIIDFEFPENNCVYTDGYKSIYNATEYLIKKGHKKIGHLGGDFSNFVGINRYNGYKQAMEDNNLSIDEKFVKQSIVYTFEDGYTFGLEYLKHDDRPTAVVCASDKLAIGIMTAYQNNGHKIPDELSIIGFDNIESTSMVSPPLTTIAQKQNVIADEAANILLNTIENKDQSKHIKVIEGELIERGSVKELK